MYHTEYMKYLNALNKIYGLGPQAMKAMVDFFPTTEAIWQASTEEIIRSGVGEKLAEKIVTERKNINPNKEWDAIKKENIQTLCISDEDYPSLLKEIYNPPYLIYTKGNKECLKMPMVAMVGSRKLTQYGQQVAYSFAKELARCGICVISGLAFGIDANCHRGALDAKGKTIAVLGNSIDQKSISPRSNYNLAQDIINNEGLLLSEFPTPTTGNKMTFPARNRIMAGISKGTLVVEAAQKSGSLITANYAIEFNREVFAVPGSIFSPQSEGCNNLIKSGAKITTSVSDVLCEFNFLHMNYKENKNTQELEKLTNEEQKIYSKLSFDPTHIDRIAKLTKLETSTVNGLLSVLEIKGAVKNIGGQNYIKLKVIKL